MNDAGQSICLVMIVKNEAHVIRRCLESTRPLIDTWLIVDTGSADGTQETIRHYLQDLSGELLQRPWVDFAHNRTEALDLARGRADYVLTIDADETIELAPGFSLPELTADSYNIEMLFDGHAYLRKQLVRDALPWKYTGVIHEYIYCPEAASEAVLPGIRTIPRHDGARARDPGTYRRDALLLENALLSEPDNTRYVFYLAQSYRDAGELARALTHYERRVAMGGWSEEIWFSLYQIAQIEDRLNRPWPFVLQRYLEAWQFCPDRAEPLFKIAMRYQAERQFAISHLFLSRAMAIPYPAGNRLFVDQKVYDYLLPAEYAVAAHYAGDYVAAIETNNGLLRSGKLPPHVIEQVIRNRRFSLDARHPKRGGGQGRIRVVVSLQPGAEETVESLRYQDDREFDVVCAGGIPEGVSVPMDLLITAIDGDVTLRKSEDDIIIRMTPRYRFADSDAMAGIRAAFEDADCRLLYGQFRLSDGQLGDAEPASSEDDFLRRGPALASEAPLFVRQSLLTECGADRSDAALWAAAGFAHTRYLDDARIALVDPPRVRVPEVEVSSIPKISCLMITRDRFSLARRAVRSFADQTHAHKELVIVMHGPVWYRRALEREIDELRIANVRFVEAPADAPLGVLRNHSLDAASGDVLCQWDDDDGSHPTRLAIQLEEMTRQNARASFLSDHLQFLEHDRTLHWTDWTIEGEMAPEWRLFPASLMMLRDPRFRYPESGPYAQRGEDSAFLGQLLSHVPVARIAGQGHLYLYRFHGRNIFEKEHHYRLATCSTRNEILQTRAEVIRDAVTYYELPRPVTVVGREGAAFTVG
jgi:glycosyltransferase involved in cell wall biosynthesis